MDAEEKQILANFAFIKTTDRRNLYTQIKGLVGKAQEVVAESLENRRASLKKMLEDEDRSFEIEFKRGVKSRYEDGINNRQIALSEIQNQQKEEKTKFLFEKFLQRKIAVCHEIRDKLRYKDTLDTNESLLEQILEKERAKRREYELDRYWERVAEVTSCKEAAEQLAETQKQKQVIEYNRRQLLCQIEENKARQQREAEEKRKDAERIDAIRRELELEEFDRKHHKLTAEQLKRGQEQRDEIERREKKRLAERKKLADEHRHLIEQIQDELLDNSVDIQKTKQAFRQTSLEFIAYVKRLRKHEKEMEQMRDNRTDDLYHVDTCTFRDIKQSRDYKLKKAIEHHAALKRQITEECEKRMREEAEYQDRHIRENRFARDETVDPVSLANARRKVRQELDEQIVEMKRVQKEEIEAFERKLLAAVDDPEDCKTLFDSVELRAHPNWKIYTCATDRTKEIQAANTKQINWADVPPEGMVSLESPHLQCSCDKKCTIDKQC